jgi:CheY-like chemotaxis protein
MEPNNRKAKLLVVEDDPDIMKILVRTLSDAGYQVVPAYGGEDAINKVRSQKFDLVLTDLAMPRVSGVDVIQAIKANKETANIPVIAVTAHVWDTIAQSAAQVGCDGYVSKPFSPKQLVTELEKHLKPRLA